MRSPDRVPAVASEKCRTPLPEAGGSSAEARPLRQMQWAQALILAALYSVSALICMHRASVADPDLWWHLRTGEWILQHHAMPHTDAFSSFGAGRPWAAYSWLYEVLLFGLFQWLGLAGLVAYTTGMVLAVTVALYRLIRRLQADFTVAVLLTLAASLCLIRLDSPRSWWFTILFFILELDLLMQARITGKTRELLWLPVIFALWANLHIECAGGLLVLALALAEAVLARRWAGVQARIRPAWLGGIFIACVLATLVNPYGWNIYRIAGDMVSQPGNLNAVDDLLALPFRSMADWGVLFFALAAAAVLARARRPAFFEGLLLVSAICVSFRSQRDLWVVVITASAILAREIKGDEKNRFQLTAFFAPCIAVVTALIVFSGARLMHLQNAGLRASLAEDMPVRAVEFVKEKNLSGPLFNDFNWGGYLIWALRLPVSIDGRTNLYGSQRLDRSYAIWNAQPGWAADPDLQRANLVIGPVTEPLTQLLRHDPRFELVYEDRLAAVFVARKASFSPPGAAAGGAGRQ
jgi:hypothetical protein